MLKCFFFAVLYNRSCFLIDIGQHLAPYHDGTREPVFFPALKRVKVK